MHAAIYDAAPCESGLEERMPAPILAAPPRSCGAVDRA
jgi:hypothetical protein